VLLTKKSFVYSSKVYTAKSKMASVQKETSSAITLKGSTEIVADFFGNKVNWTITGEASCQELIY